MLPKSPDLSVFVTHPISNLFIAKFQYWCGVSANGEAQNKTLYFLFKLGSILGEDIFYLMPLLFWFAYPLAIPFVTQFAALVLTGQFIKDYLKLPRPPANSSDGVVIAKLEKHFETEYGLPSSHTMTAFLPMSVLYTLRRYRSDLVPSISPLWPASWLYVLFTGFSRIYQGVHSPADVLAGMVLALPIIHLLDAYMDTIISFLYGSQGGVAFVFLSLPAFLLGFPRASPWRAGFGTAALVFGVWFGVAVSMHILRVMPWGSSLTSQLEQASSIHLPSAWKRVSAELSCENRSVNGSCAGTDSYLCLSDSHSPYIWVLKLIIGVPLLVAAKLCVRPVVERLLLWLLQTGVLRCKRGEEMDPFGRPVPAHLSYSVDVPARSVTMRT